MRLPLVLLALPLFALQAHAQTVPPQQSAPAVDAVTPASGAKAAVTPASGAKATGAPVAEHHRMSWKQHFVQANLTHDGHMTLQEATGGYPTVARHFKEIDADKKGYVTEEDIANWHKLQRAVRHSGQGSPNDALRPRHAFQQGTTEPRQFNTSADGQVLPMRQSDALPANPTTATK